MSPTSYQAAPPRINTLNNAPFYAMWVSRLTIAGVIMVQAPQSEAAEYRNQRLSRQGVKLTGLRANLVGRAGPDHWVWWGSAKENTACDVAGPADAAPCQLPS